MERDYRRILNSKANKTPFSPKPPGRKEGNNGDQLVTEINGDIRLYRKELNRWFYVPLSDSGKSKSTDVATSTTLGLVKIGSGLSITATGELTASGSSANYYLDGITKSSNTLTFSVNGATNQTYTFGSNAFNSTTIPTNTNELTNGAGFLTAVATANIADEAVTLAKLAHVATDIFLGRTSNGSGDVEAMSVSDVTTLLNLDNYLTSVSTLNADKLTAGTIPDARVPASAVTQHVASIVHDSLSGFVANEHIDWTSDQGSTNIHSGNYTDTNTNQLTRFYFVDDDGDSVHPSHDHYIKFMNGTGITTNWNATDAAGTSGDPHILTITSTTNGTVTAVGTSGSISGGTINTTGTITHLTSAGHSHVPTTLNQSGKFLKAGSNSGLSEAWTSITESDITDLGTYLTTSSASSTYLPKTSPTLTADTTLSMNNGKVSARTSAGGGSDGIGSAGQVLHSHGAGGGVYWGTIASAPSVNIYDGDGTEVNLANKWMKFVEGSNLIDINFTDTSDGATDDPYDLTFTINSGNITSVGTLTAGTWNGTVIASAYLDADTAHLSGAQTFSGAKTFGDVSSNVLTTIKTTGSANHSGLSLEVPASGTGDPYINFKQGSGNGSANNMNYQLVHDTSEGYFKFRSADSDGSSTDADIWRVHDGTGDMTIIEDINLSVGKLVNFGDTSGTSDRMLIRKNSGSNGEINVLSNNGLVLRTADTTRFEIENGGVSRFHYGVTLSQGGSGSDNSIYHHSNNWMYVQGGTAGLGLKGKNSDDATIYLSNSSQNIRFNTNNVIRLTIDNSKSVFTNAFQVSHATTPEITLNDTGGTSGARIFRICGGGDIVHFEGRNNDNSDYGTVPSIASMSLAYGGLCVKGAFRNTVDNNPNQYQLSFGGDDAYNPRWGFRVGDSSDGENLYLDRNLTSGSRANAMKINKADGKVTFAGDMQISDDLHFNATSAWIIPSGSGGTLRIQTFAYFRVDGVIRGYDDVIAYYSSDPTLKDNAKLIENPLDKLSKINGYTFDWNEKAQKIGKHLTGHDYGVMANEIQDVMPELVETRENGIRAVKYEKIIPLLIECIKKQQTQINELKGIA